MATPVNTTGPSKKRRSVQQLLSKTPLFYLTSGAHQIVVKQLTKAWTKSGARAVQATTYTKENGNVHTVTVIGLDSRSNKASGLKMRDVPKLSAQKGVLVDCTCGDFCFMWEYALWEVGAAKLRRCNGEPPDIKNPRHVPGVCKHLVAVLSVIKDKGL